MKHIPVRQIKGAHPGLVVAPQFNIRKVEDLLGGKDLVQDLHRHDFFFILTITCGKGNHGIDFVPYTVSRHSIFIMRPGQVHHLSLKAGSEGFLIEFKPEFYQPKNTMSSAQWRRITGMGCYKLSPAKFDFLNAQLEAMLEEFTSRREGFEAATRAYLDIFIIQLLRDGGFDIKSPGKTFTRHELVDQFLDLVESNFITEKQTARYAAMMNVSVYQLNSATQKAFGKSATDLINEHILLEAKRYLLASSNLVNQIAYLLGYEDVSYFIRFFKKHTGLTPEYFRRQFA
jgi:AraC-like DNA-binding protein